MCFLVFHCSLWCSYAFFQLGQMELVIFCLSGSGFLGDKFLSLSLIVFSEQIENLYKGWFAGDDSKCVYPWITSLDFSLFVTSCC